MTRAKFPREPVSASLHNSFAIRNHVELAGLPRRTNRFEIEALLDQGHGTRVLGAIVLSCWAVHNFELHSILDATRLSPVPEAICGHRVPFCYFRPHGRFRRYSKLDCCSILLRPTSQEKPDEISSCDGCDRSLGSQPFSRPREISENGQNERSSRPTLCGSCAAALISASASDGSERTERYRLISKGRRNRRHKGL